MDYNYKKLPEMSFSVALTSIARTAGVKTSDEDLPYCLYNSKERNQPHKDLE